MIKGPATEASQSQYKCTSSAAATSCNGMLPVPLQVATAQTAIAAMKDLAQSQLQLPPGSGAVITNGRVVLDSDPSDSSPRTGNAYLVPRSAQDSVITISCSSAVEITVVRVGCCTTSASLTGNTSQAHIDCVRLCTACKADHTTGHCRVMRSVGYCRMML